MYKRFSLLNILCSVVNNSRKSSIDSIIAHYFLDNFERIYELNIYDVATECYCTRQTIRRFCQKIGFSNFTSLKNYSIRYNHIRWEQLHRFDSVNFREESKMKIFDAFLEIDKRDESGQIETVVDLIYKHDNIFFFVDESIEFLIFQFQKGMIYHNKIVKLVSNGLRGTSIVGSLFEYSEKNMICESIGENDLIITISLTGNFARAIDNLFDNINSKKILITNDYDLDQDNYNFTFFISSENMHYSGTNEYTIFGLNYYLELLQYTYFQKYGNKKLLEDKRSLDKM